MQISRLQWTKNSKKVNIYLDDKYSLSVLQDTIVACDLYKGKQLNKQELESIKKIDAVNMLYTKIISWITIRPRSISEAKEQVAKHLYKSETKFTTDIAAEIIEKLISKGYLDDVAFAKWWVQNRVAAGKKSSFEIKNELLQKQIDRHIITNVLEQNVDQTEQLNVIRKMIEKKLRLLKYKKLSEFEIQTKLKFYLSQKGFAWDLINIALQDFYK